MSGTSLVILTMYSTVNVVTPGALDAGTVPYLLALLMMAAALTCAAMFSLYQAPNRSAAKGATIRKVRRFSGPAPRRL